MRYTLNASGKLQLVYHEKIGRHLWSILEWEVPSPSPLRLLQLSWISHLSREGRYTGEELWGSNQQKEREGGERFLFSFDSTRPSQYLWHFSSLIWSCAHTYRSWNIWTLTQPIRELIVKHSEPFLHVLFPHLLWTSSWGRIQHSSSNPEIPALLSLKSVCLIEIVLVV